MSDKEEQAEAAGGGGSLTEEAGETTAADMVRGPEDTRPVGADTMVKVAGPGRREERER